MGAIALLLWGLASIHVASSLTCYNGMKLIRGQSVGQQTEECAAGASCYNMTSSAAFVVDVVKAGCSTWRCMMAKDRCIGININFVPVSLCCCSHDRCNVMGNPTYSSGGMGGGSNYGGGGYGGGGGSGYGGGGNAGETAGGWGAPGYPGVKAGGEQGGSPYGGGGSAGGYGGYGSGGYGGNNNNNNNNNGGGSQMGGSQYGGGGYGGFGGYGGDNAGKVNIGMDNAAKPQNKKPSLTQEQIENAFKNFDVDNKQHGTGGDVEEAFEVVDVKKTTPRPRGPAAPGGKINL